MNSPKIEAPQDDEEGGINKKPAEKMLPKLHSQVHIHN
jgi:hypothetical protein